MSCLISGCNFLLKNISQEAFVYRRHADPEYEFELADPDIFPYMLVNIGSGVSILKLSFYKFYYETALDIRMLLLMFNLHGQT